MHAQTFCDGDGNVAYLKPNCPNFVLIQAWCNGLVALFEGLGVTIF